MPHPHDQSQYQVRFEWGREGLATLSPADVVVLVDTLSFTTAVDVATSLGVIVVPHGMPAPAALEHATIAARRGGSPSLSPASLTAESLAGISRLVLPSPNGSRIAADLGAAGVTVVAACLRNRTAVAEWLLAEQARRGTRLSISVIASGELRGDGSVRFAVEDLLAAGAVIDALAHLGIDHNSPEAAAASASFEGLRHAVGHLISASASGKELVAEDYRDDVRLAAQLDCSVSVPVLGPEGFAA